MTLGLFKKEENEQIFYVFKTRLKIEWYQFSENKILGISQTQVSSIFKLELEFLSNFKNNIFTKRTVII